MISVLRYLFFVSFFFSKIEQQVGGVSHASHLCVLFLHLVMSH